MPHNLLDSTRETFARVKQGAYDATHHMQESTNHAAAHVAEQTAQTTHQVRDYAERKIDELTQQFNAELPMIEAGGYCLTALEIDLGVTPQINCRFSINDKITPEQSAQAIEEAKAHKLAHTLLTALNKARSAQSGVRIGALRLQDIQVTMGALPKVQLRFRQPGSDAEEPTVVTGQQVVTQPPVPRETEAATPPPASKPRSEDATETGKESSPASELLDSFLNPSPVVSGPPPLPERPKFTLR